MITIPGKIPILIHPTFWIFSALIGFINSQSLIGTLVWVGIIFVSILFHEFGHALMALIFGKKPRIELVALGGLTYHSAENLSLGRQFLIVLNGPLFGLILCGVVYFIAQKIPQTYVLWTSILSLMWIVNLFWTAVNLVPVLPLDGGQMMRLTLEAFFGLKGIKIAFVISIILATLGSLAAFLYGQLFIGALFSLFAFQSYDAYRRSRSIAESDRRSELKTLFEDAEEALQKGKIKEAQAMFEEICKAAKKGLIFNLAAQYLAFLEYENGDSKKAYDLLKKIRAELSGDSLCLLHKVAFEQKDFPLVIELAAPSFQALPTPEIAFRNACAHAQLSQVAAAIGWLETAIQEGVEHLEEVIAEKNFDPIRKDRDFQQFVAHLTQK